jgi:hypothetical protein
MNTYRGSLVECADGTLVRVQDGEIKATDCIVFDGPDAFAEVAHLEAAFEAEISAAGGLQAWKAQALHPA